MQDYTTKVNTRGRVDAEKKEATPQVINQFAAMPEYVKRQLFDVYQAVGRNEVEFLAIAMRFPDAPHISEMKDIYQTFTIAREDVAA